MDETGEFIVDGHTVRYTITDVLGLGSFGVVHRATAKAWEKSDTETADSIELAVKSLFIAGSHSPESDGQLTKELEVVLKLRHPNLVRYFTTFGRAPRLPNERPTWVIVMEYCTGGNLAKFLIDTPTLSADEVLTYYKQILNGLACLHEHKLIHADIKPENIVVSKSLSGDIVLKICDMDDPILLAGSVTISDDVKDVRGSAPYFSPEMAAKWGYRMGGGRDGKTGRTTDIWSLGCVVLDLASALPTATNRVVKFIKQIVSSTSASEINFKSLIVKTGTSAEEIIRFIVEGGIRHVPESLPPNLKAVVFNCLQVNPQNRPSAEQLLAAVEGGDLSYLMNDPITELELINMRAQVHTASVEIKPDVDGIVCITKANNQTLPHADELYKPDLRTLLNRFHDFKRNRLLNIHCFGLQNLPLLLDRVSEKIAVLTFEGRNWSSGCLQGISLPNLLELSFHQSFDIILEKAHFVNLPAVRSLAFRQCTFRFIEENVFAQLPCLQYVGLSLDWTVEKLDRLSPSDISSLHQLEFGPEYDWLRRYFREEKNVSLTTDKKVGELWCIGSAKSCAYESQVLTLPELNKTFEDSVVNLPCFTMEPYSSEEIEALVSHFFPEVLISFSVNSPWYVTWDWNNSPEDIHGLLVLLIRLDKKHPVKLEIIESPYPTEESISAPLLARALSPVSEQICILIYRATNSTFDVRKLEGLQLPNLLELRLEQWDDVRLTKKCFNRFPHLRSLILQNCTVAHLEENLFETASCLKFVALDYRTTSERYDYRQREAQKMAANYERRHVSPEYQWLRDYFERNLHLGQAKKEGEVWQFRRGKYCYLSDAFISAELEP
ncbi:putative Mitogen-activated protein kinase kinase kinase YODA [Hypsibius exemplaris]|uniref:Mitogen-activated protein kinase kinase kinase YODA n=1 Tax=Hypsibius exemplaris TaxID=2072580 RepID=A0A9X6NIY7_HYPEX|nr:putative Mitogen-activated protein kinase kinase kinase YODA [Hypsibius exemplaris]